MSYPDKLIVSNAVRPADCNGEYFPYTYTGDIPTYRRGNYVIAPVIQGGSIAKWVLKFFTDPTGVFGVGDEIGFANTNLAGQYAEQNPDLALVFGAKIFERVPGEPEDVNGVYRPVGLTSFGSTKYQRIGSPYMLERRLVSQDYALVNDELRPIFPGLEDHVYYYKSFGDQSVPFSENYIPRTPTFGPPPPIIVRPSYFFSGAPTVEAAFNRTPGAIEPTDLLPPNATAQERALSLATARAGGVPMQIKQVWNPQTCPAGILPWLAWALSVDDWKSDWTEQQKRDAIAASVQVHRTKGTVGAVRRALQALGYEVLVNENTGTPYTFRLQVDIGEAGGNEALYNEAERIALRSKNARSHLLGVDALGQIRGGSRIASAGIDGNTTRVWPDVVELLARVDLQRILSAEQTIDTTRVSPDVPDTAEFVGGPRAGGAFTYDLAVTL